MKRTFFKTIVAAGALAVLFACSDSATPSIPSVPEYATFNVTGDCYWLSGDSNYLIYESNNVVTDENGNKIGVYDPATGVISDLDGNPLVENVDLSGLTHLTPEMVAEANASASENSGENPGDVAASSASQSGSQTTPATSGTSTVTSSASGATGPSASGKVDASGYPVMNYEKLTEGGAGVTKGHATRYWDACKPHCSWPEKVNSSANPYRIARNCSIDGYTEIPAFTKSEDGTWLKGTVSSCDGGGAYTCLDMIPVEINDTLSYAFGAAPGADANSTCGKCYQIQFTGEGKYGTKAAHKLLKSKTLIIMASNVGYDVAGGQFDIMIPGGGVGIFDALTKQLNYLGGSSSDMGERSGGIYTTCENRLGADASVEQFKQCVTEGCNKAFSGNETLLQGCMWFVNWYETANNPITLFKQVECPQYLVDKFTSTLNTSPNLNSTPAYKNY